MPNKIFMLSGDTKTASLQNRLGSKTLLPKENSTKQCSDFNFSDLCYDVWSSLLVFVVGDVFGLFVYMLWVSGYCDSIS